VTRPDLADLDRELRAARVVAGIRRDVAQRLAVRARRRWRVGLRRRVRVVGLVLTAIVAALLAWLARVTS
jgi:hypothetical protein